MEKKLQPSLRFLGFNKEWEILKVKDFIHRNKGALKIGPFGSQLKKDTFVDEGFKVYGQENIILNDFSIGDRYITDNHFEKLKTNELHEGDFVISTMGTIGKCAIVPEGIQKGIMDSHMIRMQLDQEKVSPKFLSQLFVSDLIYRQIKSLSVGGIMDGLSIGITNELKFPITNLAEQEKIADFLSSIDENIESIEDKLKLMEKYRKGVMQKIFSQEIRFKDEEGKEYPEWQYLRAKEIFRNSSNKNHDGDLPLLAVTQDKGVVYRNELELKINSSEAGVKNYKIIEPGDFVISLRSFQGGIEYSEILGISSPAYTVLKAKLPINDEVYRRYLKKEDFISKLNKAVIGIRDGKQISFSVFGALKLPYPCIEEQSKIAEFLSSIDEEIKILKEEIKGNKEFKKGLLQQMFM